MLLKPFIVAGLEHPEAQTLMHVQSPSNDVAVVANVDVDVVIHRTEVRVRETTGVTGGDDVMNDIPI